MQVHNYYILVIIDSTTSGFGDIRVKCFETVWSDGFQIFSWYFSDLVCRIVYTCVVDCFQIPRPICVFCHYLTPSAFCL